MARGVPVLSFSRLRQCWWTGSADHDDVQPHGRAAEMADGRSLREDHGLPARSYEAKEGHWRSPMKWITRQRIQVNRTATCWLIQRFLDPKAEFLFVPAESVASM